VEVRLSKRDPWVAAARKDMADVYRAVRKDSPVTARLLKRRYDTAYKELAADFHRRVYETGTGAGEGLAGAFE
jgi:hypothetical protein